MPIFIATIRDNSERVRVWEETDFSLYDVPFVKRHKDAVGRYWIVGVNDDARRAVRQSALLAISREKERRGL